MSERKNSDVHAREARIEALLKDWEETAKVNLTGVGRAYADCAREMREAMAVTDV